MNARVAMLVVALLGLALSACAGLEYGTASGPPVAAPTVKVGDRWVYRAREGFRLPATWEETHEVTGVGTAGITVLVSYGGPTITGSRTEVWTAPGLVSEGALMDIETRRFATPLQRYAFPLVPGTTWNQWVKDFNQDTRKAGEINRYVRVSGWEKVTTPAGTFDAIRLRIFMRLDDEEFWRGPTQCNYLVWYAPAVGATVREEKAAEYWEKGDHRDGVGAVRAQNTTLELVSFHRG
jgi:hypothetical protein